MPRQLLDSSDLYRRSRSPQSGDAGLVETATEAGRQRGCVGSCQMVGVAVHQHVADHREHGSSGHIASVRSTSLAAVPAAAVDSTTPLACSALRDRTTQRVR